MPAIITRKNFLAKLSFATGTVVGTPLLVLADQQDKPPALPAELVKEFVIAGHGNPDKIKQMLAAEPGLLNACWDWGGGDFETAIEGAGHVGSKDCANYLLSKGARINVFCAAMLGNLSYVKALLDAHPDLKTSRGPHGLQLIHHATKGGADAKEVLVYLESIGAA